MEHDLRDVIFARKDRRPHADEIHPAADEAVDECADGRSRRGFLRRARIVRDERQPRERHGNRELKRHRKAHRLACGAALRCARPAHDDAAEEHREEEEPRHGDGVHALNLQNADADPDDDERTDHEAPEPVSRIHHTVGRKRTVVDHDRCPADELHDVQHRKEQSPARPERHLHRLHRAAPRPRADEPREKEQEAADHMPCDDGRTALAEPQRCKECSR